MSKMAIDSGDVLRAAAYFSTDGGSQAVNVYHYVMTGESGVDEEQVLLDLRDDIVLVMNELSGIYSEDVILDEVEAWVLEVPSLEWSNIGSAPTIWHGTSTNNQTLPQMAAMLARVSTSNPKSQARKYFPAPNEVSQDDGRLGTGALEKLANAAVQWVTGYVSGPRTYVPGVWSVVDETFYTLGDNPIVTNLLAQQGRRKYGIGS